MPDDKKTSSSPFAGTAKNSSKSTRSKKLTLSQRVKEQALQIEELTIQLQQKEQELEAMGSQAHLIEDLGQKLQKTEQSMQTARAQAESQGQAVDKLNTQLRLKEQQLTTVSEQATLVDELSDKLRQVEIKLAGASINHKNILAQNIVKTHMIAGMSLGLLPTPLFDIVALTGTELNLLRTLSGHYDVRFDEQTGKTVLASLFSGALPVVTIISLSSLLKIIPGFGTLGGGISMTVLSGTVTYATGQVFIRHFEAGGTFKNFNSKHWQAYFRQQIKEGKMFVRNKFKTPETQTVTNKRDADV